MATSERGDISATGSLTVADGVLMRGNVRCEGDARLGTGAALEGDIDVTGAVAVGSGARITGLLACGGALEWHPTASAGELRCEGGLQVDGVQIATRVHASQGIGPEVE